MNEPATTTLHHRLAEVEAEIAAAEQELRDLAAGRFRLQRADGLVIEAELTGEEFRLGEQAEVLAALGYSREKSASTQLPDPQMLRGYLPFLVIAGGLALLLCAIVRLVPALIQANPAELAATQTALTLAFTPTATPRPSPTPPATPTPSLLPDGHTWRAPAKLSLPGSGLSWGVVKGNWQSEGGSLSYLDDGVQVAYFDGLAGRGNLVIGGDGSTPDAPLYPLRSLDLNDTVVVENRAGDLFHYRLVQLDEDRVELWLTPTDAWVARPQADPILTLVIRVAQQRLVFRGRLVEAKLKKE